ncbi:MAG TPA: hypothetical protein VIN58_24390 [Roseateles sp.]
MRSALLALIVAGFAASAHAAPPAQTVDGAFVGPSGLALYTFDRDATPGKSVCNDRCATNWPPLTAAADAKDEGEWTIVTRDDGSKQWAYKGKPIYYFAKDQKAGDRTGDNVNQVWHLAKP